MSEYETKRLKKQAGFTLVEVMVTMVIIGLLAAVVFINVRPAQDKGLVTKTKVDISRLSQALEMYRLDTNVYPESLALLVDPAGGDATGASQDGYIRALPDDPWGRPYQYAYPGENGAYDIWSFGADGQEGGEGINADITSWDR
jgi:general secretion pathway protein G